MRRGLDGYFSLLACVQFSSLAGADRSRTISVVIARGKHLFPFRTEPLSPSAPMVLGGQPPGRVGRRRSFFTKAVQVGGFRIAGATRPRSGRSRRGSSRGRAVSRGSATRCGCSGRTGPRAGVMPHRRCGGSSPAPPIRAGDRVWDAGRSVGEWTPPRVSARGHIRQVWRSRLRGRHRRQLAGQGRCARGTWGAD